VYCTRCGGVVTDGVAFCTTCGQAVPGAGGVVARTQVGGTVTTYPAPAGTQYSGFWIRFAAYLIDGLIMSAGILVLFIPSTAALGLSSAMSGMRWDRGMEPAQITLLVGWIFLLLGLAVLVTWLYHALLESSAWQATIGKRAVGLIVTDLAGRPISFARASGRHFAKFISNLIPFEIGYIMAAFTDKRQALHDMIAGCLILKNNSLR
jgi:uncharacterized RDD family membrane protein YckC